MYDGVENGIQCFLRDTLQMQTKLKYNQSRESMLEIDDDK